jgi:hypothetical protein
LADDSKTPCYEAQEPVFSWLPISHQLARRSTLAGNAGGA